MVVSTQPLDESCLTKQTAFQWRGVERSVYRHGQ